jgi:NMD protein affecting ribosome stability and mRNA decay
MFCIQILKFSTVRNMSCPSCDLFQREKTKSFTKVIQLNSISRNIVSKTQLVVILAVSRMVYAPFACVDPVENNPGVSILMFLT